jgi:hypothetical protein
VKRGLEVWGDTGRVALVPVNTATCKTTHTTAAMRAGCHSLNGVDRESVDDLGWPGRTCHRCIEATMVEVYGANVQPKAAATIYCSPTAGDTATSSSVLAIELASTATRHCVIGERGRRRRCSYVGSRPACAYNACIGDCATGVNCTAIQVTKFVCGMGGTAANPHDTLPQGCKST